MLKLLNRTLFPPYPIPIKSERIPLVIEASGEASGPELRFSLSCHEMLFEVDLQA